MEEVIFCYLPPHISDAAAVGYEFLLTFDGRFLWTSVHNETLFLGFRVGVFKGPKRLLLEAKGSKSGDGCVQDRGVAVYWYSSTSLRSVFVPKRRLVLPQ